MKDKKMKACAAIEKGVLKIVDVAIPAPDDYECLVKNEGCLFCNTTDRMIIEDLFSTPAYPTLLGHEDFGIVVKVGKKVKKFRLGDRVICANAIVSGFNGEYYSTWGGFAEYGIAGDLQAYLKDGGTLDGKNAYRSRYQANVVIPNDLPREKAGLVFSLSETASALLQVGDLKGKTVVIIGTGFVGYSFIQFAKLYGAKTVVCLGRREERLRIARKLGADQGFIDLAEANEYIRSVGGADVVLEASGNYKVLENGLPYLKENGIFAIYAVPHQPYSFDLMCTPRRFSVLRIEPHIDEALPFVCRALENDEICVNDYLTHQWDFGDIVTAYNDIRNGRVIKGLVHICK